MQKELKEKLEKLGNKFIEDTDIISLKALCLVPENEQINLAIENILERLIEKYPTEREILDLKNNNISLEKLLEKLQEKYSNNIEVITLKALVILPKENNREKAINECLKRLLMIKENDEDIINYLSKENGNFQEELHENMILVNGGKYIPSFFMEKRNVFDLYVGKYPVTQKEWNELFFRENPSYFKGDSYPMTNLNWIETLEYCNKLSEYYELQPVYEIEDKELKAIIYKSGEKVEPNLALFEKTEGYRLPTMLEWEWIARGGNEGIKNKTFNCLYAGSNNIDEVAWFVGNSNEKTHPVGTKKANALGIYDCTGNVWEICYDAFNFISNIYSEENGLKETFCKNIFLPEERPYIYDVTSKERGVKGGAFCYNEFLHDLRFNQSLDYKFSNIQLGFRIVRTASPKI